MLLLGSLSPFIVQILAQARILARCYSQWLGFPIYYGFFVGMLTLPYIAYLQLLSKTVAQDL